MGNFQLGWMVWYGQRWMLSVDEKNDFNATYNNDPATCSVYVTRTVWRQESKKIINLKHIVRFEKLLPTGKNTQTSTVVPYWGKSRMDLG